MDEGLLKMFADDCESGASPARKVLEQTLIGTAPQMVHLREKILNFAAADADVLILGETGAGKDVIARSLHNCGPRSGRRFVAVNCGALPESVIESELFGHEAGAFTGASKTRLGKIEFADAGTLFLDEIESMPLGLQVKLLRVLQDRVVNRLGSNEERAVDIRVIAATKEDLKQAGERREFRPDLYYRLNVLGLTVPSLRERSGDILPLFVHFARQAASRFKTRLGDLTPHDRARLVEYRWPGNVRELQNVALRFALGLGIELQSSCELTATASIFEDSLSSQLSRAEREIVRNALQRNNFSLKATYRELAISRKTLYDKMRRFGLGRAASGASEE